MLAFARHVPANFHRRQQLPRSLQYSKSEADLRARKTPTSHNLLSAGAWPASSCMRVALGFHQEHAPSKTSVTSVTQDGYGHVHFKPPIRGSFGPCTIALLRYLACSSRLQLRAIGYHPVLEITPQRDCEASCHRDDGNAPCATIRSRALRALVEPLRQRAVGLVAQPAPRDLDEQGAHPSIALPADAFVHLALATVVGLRHQSDARTYLTPVAELPSEQLEREARPAYWPDSLQPLELIDSLARGRRQTRLPRLLKYRELLLDERQSLTLAQQPFP
jgi:hypothetical protein